MRVTPRREHARVTFEVVGLVGLKNHPVEPSGAGRHYSKPCEKPSRSKPLGQSAAILRGWENRHPIEFSVCIRTQDWAEPVKLTGCGNFSIHVNDPSAGSPTETLLRLLLPLNEQICTILIASSSRNVHLQSPKDSSIHPIGRSDGRCVQRAGT